jgi:ankyrin repeat protein
LGRPDIVKLLIENNADVRLTDDGGRSALHAAALHVPSVLEGLTPTGRDDDDAVVVLAAQKQSDGVHQDALSAVPLLDPNADRDLVVTAFEPSARVVDVLVAAGAEVGFKNAGPDGVTPLHLAALVGNIGVAASLLAAGASIDARDAMGRTPLECALQPSPQVSLATSMRRGHAVLEGLRVDPWPAFKLAKYRILELLLAEAVARDDVSDDR